MPSPDSVWYTRCPAPTPLSIAYQLGWVDRRPLEAANRRVAA